MTISAETFVTPSAPIIEAMKIIDSNDFQIALVVDEHGRLVGTVTDGDVRRAILRRGIALDAHVTEIMNKKPITVGEDEDREKVLAIMTSNKIRQVPVINDKGEIVRIEYLSELVKVNRCDNDVVLMAGGLGKRLHPLTTSCPKPMLKVGSKPILETIIENFISYGFWKFHISVNYKAEKLMEYFEDGSKWGVEISYIHENDALGTAGALGLLGKQSEKSLIVMNGDVLSTINFQQLLNFHQEQRSHATMCVREYGYQIPYGVVNVDNNSISSIVEKPTQSLFVNAGIYVLEAEITKHVAKGTRLDMPDLFKLALELKLNAIAFPIREYWMDVGQMVDFERANVEYDKIFPARNRLKEATR